LRVVLEYMAQKSRPKGAASAPIKNKIVHLLGVVAIATSSYAAMTGSVFDPAFEPQPQLERPTAGVIFSGAVPVIIGPVSRLFSSATFVGPNRAEKTDRLRNKVDVVEFARLFGPARVKLARLRANQPVDIAVSPKSSLLDIINMTKAREAPRPGLAAIDPALASAALAAIAKATPLDPLIPRPGVISSRLAYARASAPTSEPLLNRYSERDRWCLSTAVYFEARGESYRGQVAVAQVVINRVKHRLYPDTICGVVFQNQNWRDRCQFSFACDGIPERVTDQKAWALAREISLKVTQGKIYLSEVANATHYHANYVHPDWARRMEKVTTIGAHVFYRFRS